MCSPEYPWNRPYDTERRLLTYRLARSCCFDLQSIGFVAEGLVSAWLRRRSESRHTRAC